MQHVLQELTRVHQLDIVHRDIKPGNLLLREEHVYLTDFEMAESITESTTTYGGTPQCWAPEQRKHRRLGTRPWQIRTLKKADVYGAAMTFARLLMRQPNGPLTAAEIRQGLPSLGTRHADKALRALFTTMLRTLPSQRPTAKQALQRLTAILEPLSLGGVELSKAGEFT